MYVKIILTFYESTVHEFRVCISVREELQITAIIDTNIKLR